MITTLTGSNAHSLKASLNDLRQAFVKTYTDIGLEQYDCAELDPQRLPSILQAQPFLAEKRMVILQQPSAQKVIQEDLEKLLNTVSDTTDLVIVEPKPDKRTSYYKALQKQTELRDYKELDEYELSKWLVDEAKAGQGSISSSDASYLVKRLGVNQLLLGQELKKLLSYDPKVTRQTIDLLTVPNPQSNVFDLLDAALSGNQAKVIELYHEQRQQKVEPLAIMGMLAWQLHILALVKTAGPRNASQIASEAKVSPYVVRKTEAVAARCSAGQVKSWVSKAAQLDVRLKSQAIDADDAMLEFLLSLH